MLVLILFLTLIGRSDNKFILGLPKLDKKTELKSCPTPEDIKVSTSSIFLREQKTGQAQQLIQSKKELHNDYLIDVLNQPLLQSEIVQDPNTCGWILPSIIDTTLKLESNKIYHIRGYTYLLDGCKLYIPSNTIVTLGTDWESGLIISPHAKLITGYREGLDPDIENPDVLDTRVFPTYFVAENLELFIGYGYGIVYLGDEESETPVHHELNNVYIEGAYIGVYSDNVELVVTNSFFFGCYKGIVSYGPANLIAINNQITYHGCIAEGYYGSYGFGISRTMVDSEDQQHPESIFYSQNNTINDGDGAIFVNSNCTTSEEDAPTFVSVNDILSYSVNYAALTCTNGYLKIGVYNDGFYSNTEHQNFPFPMYNITIEDTFPYQNPGDGYRYLFLKSTSRFVDVGLGLAPELFPGLTTNLSGEPDRDGCDLGVHYYTSYVSTSTELRKTDLNEDGITNEEDYQIFSPFWLKDISDPNDYLNDPDYPMMIKCDFNGDKILNLGDSCQFSYDWNKTYYGVETTINIFDAEGNELLPSNVYGYVEIQFSELPGGTIRSYLTIDNTIFGVADITQGRFSALIDTTKETNGYHSLTVTSLTETGMVVVSEPISIQFHNILYLAEGEDTYTSSKDYRYTGFYDGSKTVQARLFNTHDQSIGYAYYTDKFVDIVIPPEGFYDNKFCTLSLEEIELTPEGSDEIKPLSSSDYNKYDKELTKSFDPYTYDQASRMIIIVQDKTFLKERKRAIYQCAKVCEDRNIPYTSLFYHDITYENLYMLYNNPCVRYVYWCGYGGNRTGNVVRTYSMIWGKKEGIFWDSWEEVPIYSWTTRSIPSSPPLPDSLDATAADMMTIGMTGSWDKKLVIHDVSLNGTYSDMATTYGVFSLEGQGSLDQVYISWRCNSNHEVGIFNFLQNSTDGLVKFFEALGAGQGVRKALEYSYLNCSSTVNKVIWGDNLKAEIGDIDGDDNIFVWGLGIINLNDIKLQ
jgi:hypothetical protein